MTTEDGDEYDLQSKERISEVIHAEYNSTKIDEEKDSNSDENSEKLVLKSSSTEYNFYNSDDSRGPSMVSSNSSQFNQFRKMRESRKFNASLGVVKEVSNKSIEEDPDEEMRTSKETEKDQNLVFDVEQNEGSVRQSPERVESSNSSNKSDVNKIVEYMKDLVDRCKSIMSFYSEKKTQEPMAYQCEMAYLLNKI